jgi:hypothetical protein
MDEENIKDWTLDSWMAGLQALGIVRNRDRLLDYGDRIALDLGGQFYSYPKRLLYQLIQEAKPG